MSEFASTNEQLLPDIDWIKIEAGSVNIEGKKYKAPEFLIARYPITNSQYQCFVDDQGYQQTDYWEGLPETKIRKSNWQHANRPKTEINWYETLAFCRWLSSATGAAITLPTEPQWYLAATGGNEKIYPWGNDDKAVSLKANVDGSGEKNGAYLAETSSVGLYPSGETSTGIADMSGNVWEWCLNLYENIEHILLEVEENLDKRRALRGGGWSYSPEFAVSANRYRNHPGAQNNYLGFRVVCALPSESLAL